MRGGTRKSAPVFADAATKPVAGVDEADETPFLREDGTLEAPPADSVSAFGRYRLEDLIGSGGMGVVYRAYDPMLERHVALKIVRPARGGTRAQRRLFREAQLLAQVHHPNVVSVHDVGVLGKDVFVAMEFGKDTTPLSRWQEGRGLDEVLRVYLEAGQGLAAAHDCGLVHRDVKPDNILVDERGHATVIDFGLATLSRGPDSLLTTDASRSDALTPPSLEERLTQAGALVGTPRYMAPEQHLSTDDTDARSDQYSFAVALYEALCGAWPFAHEEPFVSAADLLQAKLSGTLCPPARKVPRRVMSALHRALQAEQCDRYDSMKDLLRALEPRTRRAPVVWAFTGCVAVAAALIVPGALKRAAHADAQARCATAAQGIDEVWGAGARASIERAFSGAGVSYAADAAQRVVAQLDQRAESWEQTRREVCEATWLRGEQSEALLDVRMGCLDRRRYQMSSLVELLGRDGIEADNEARSVQAAYELDDGHSCAEATVATPPPSDAATRGRLEQLREGLASAEAQERLGRYREGLAKAKEIAESSAELGYGPLQAEVDLVMGRLLLANGDFKEAELRLRSAGLHGARVEDDGLVANAWTRLIRALIQQARYDNALEASRFAEVAVARAGDLPLQRGLLELAIGAIHLEKADYQIALQHSLRARELVEAALGTEHPTVAKVLETLRDSYHALGKYAEARAVNRRALELRERAFGDSHPLVAASVYSVAMDAYRVPDYERSEALFRRALRLFRNAYGEEHPETASAYSGLGVLMYNAGRYAEAEGFLRRTISLRKKVLGPDHPTTASSMSTLGSVLYKLARYDEGDAFLHEALGIFERKLGPKHPDVAGALMKLARARAAHGDMAVASGYFERTLEIQRDTFGAAHDQVARTHVIYGQGLRFSKKWKLAVIQYQAALAIYKEIHSSDHLDLSAPLFGVGACYVELGQPRAARPPLERALAILERHPGWNPAFRAAVEIDLARALWDEPAERARSRSLAQSAKALLQQDGRAAAAAGVAKIDDWLRKHRLGRDPGR